MLRQTSLVLLRSAGDRRGSLPKSMRGSPLACVHHGRIRSLKPMAGDISIWMPWYIRDYLADTSRLTTEQHGGYLLLIADYWMSGPLPSDDDTLARITKMSAKNWAISGPILRAFFTTGADGRLYHKRIEEELRKARNKRESTVGRAKKAAESRWGKNAPADSSSMPQALLEDVLADAPSPSPSPIPSKSSYTTGSSGRKAWRQRSASFRQRRRFSFSDSTCSDERPSTGIRLT